MAVGDNLKISGLQDVTVVQAIGGAIARNPASPGAVRVDDRLGRERDLRKPVRSGGRLERRGRADHGRRAAGRRAAGNPVARQQGAVRHRLLAAERVPIQRRRLRRRRAAELHRRRRSRRARGAFHRRLGTARRRDARRSGDRHVARRPPAHRLAHLRGGRIRQGAGDPRRASPRLRQCARHRRRHRARRAARRRRR